MNYIKHVSIKFARTHKLYGKEITLKKLLFAAKQNGYVVKNYSTSEHMMIMLGVYERAKKSSSVALIEGKGDVYIFIDDSMPEQKQLFALAHELGHITLKHDPQKQKKRQFEREANLFAHYLLDTDYDIKRIFNAIKILIAILCLLFAFIFYLLCNEISLPNDANSHPHQQTQAPSQSSNQRPSENSSETSNQNNTSAQIVFYYTPYGTVYHLYRDCQYLKNANVVYSTTTKVKDIDRICSACQKHYYQE